jgi:hypothetical protein
VGCNLFGAAKRGCLAYPRKVLRYIVTWIKTDSERFRWNCHGVLFACITMVVQKGKGQYQSSHTWIDHQVPCTTLNFDFNIIDSQK